MHISSQHPFFFVNGEKIYYVFDVPHLLKSTRNNFYKYKFQLSNDLTDKTHLNDFYKADQGLNRCVLKLIVAHKYLGPFQKRKSAIQHRFSVQQ